MNFVLILFYEFIICCKFLLYIHNLLFSRIFTVCISFLLLSFSFTIDGTVYHTFIFHKMADNEAWSSGESEPENEVLENEDIGEIDSKDFYYNETQLFEDAHFYPPIKYFEGSSEINPNISFSGNKPIDYFSEFCVSSLLQNILEETNRYASQNPITESSRMKAWSPDIKTELENFLGLSILIGHVQKDDLQSYWSTILLLHTPICCQIMSLDRYMHILRCLHFHDNEEIVNHPFVKIKSVIGHVQSKFSTVLTPGKNLCIDENILIWKGRIRFKQYIPLKKIALASSST